MRRLRFTSLPLEWEGLFYRDCLSRSGAKAQWVAGRGARRRHSRAHMDGSASGERLRGRERKREDGRKHASGTGYARGALSHEPIAHILWPTALVAQSLRQPWPRALLCEPTTIPMGTTVCVSCT